MKKLIKSYKFWTALAGAVGLFVTSISDFVGISISAEGVKETIMAFCGILVSVGIVKLPQKTETKIEEKTKQEELKNASKTDLQNTTNLEK